MSESFESKHSRRQFLSTLAALGAGFALPEWMFASSTAEKNAALRVIDVHQHFFPPAFVRTLENLRTRDRTIDLSLRKESEWTPQNALMEMDKNGIATAILSIPIPPIIWSQDPKLLRNPVRECNEYGARLIKDNPSRFGFFAVVPLPDSEGSVREITHALDTLKADGIGLITNYGSKWLGDAAYARVFDELNRRKAVVYVHPTAADCCRDLMPGIPAPLIEFPHDTTRAITSLLYSGTFNRCQDIRFIFSHAGGTIPQLVGRLRQAGDVFGINKKLPNGVDYELKRLYYEIAVSANQPAMTALMTIVPASHILFGSDAPFVPIAATADGITKLGLSDNDLHAIRRDTALTLFPRFKP